VLALVGACVACAWPDDSTLVPRDGGHPGGDPLWARLFLAALVLAFALYVVAWLVLRRHDVRLRVVLPLAVAIQLAPLAAPLLLSTDAWTYWDYGRIAAVHGASPYTTPPDAYPADPAFRWTGTAWRGETSVYGPAFTLASEPLARTSSHDLAAWTYKTIAAACMLVALALATRLARRPALACVLVGWNPLLAVHLAGGGHNDAWIAALVLGALALGAAGRRQLPGVLWALAIFVKWVPILFLPLRALEARAMGRRVGHAGFAATVVLLSALATWRYGLSWIDALGPLARNANRETSFALPHRLEQLGAPDTLATVVFAAGFAAVYAWLAVRRRARLGLTACALLLATPYLAPWYLAWVVPLAAAEDDDAAAFVSLALCAYLIPQTIPV
jgi:hypothetical protein